MDLNRLDVRELKASELILSFWLSQALLLVPGVLILWVFFLRRGYTLHSFYSIDNPLGIWLGGTIVAVIGLCFQWWAWRVFSVKAFDDGGINRLLLSLPLVTLIPMFAFGAFSEELLIRGVLQTGVVPYFSPLGGIFVTSFIFTGIHYRYLKKPVLLGGVFILSLILGLLYVHTGTLWASVWAHFIYNLGAAWLAKKFYLPRIQAQFLDD